jgi:hypothetical protein
MYPLWEPSQHNREFNSEEALWTWVMVGALVNLVFVFCIMGLS